MLDREVQFAIPDFAMLLRLTRQGHGVTEAPDFLVRKDIAEGRLVRVLPDWQSPPVEILLARRPGVSRVSRVAAVLEEARKAVSCVLAEEYTQPASK